MDGGSAAVAAAAGKWAARELWKLARRPLDARGWRLAGSVEMGDCVGRDYAAGCQIVREDWWWGNAAEDDPPRLIAPAGDCEIFGPYRYAATDGASVPKMVQLAGKAAGLHLSPDAFRLPAWLHDGFYRAGAALVGLVGASSRCWVRLSRPEADALFLIALRCAGATAAECAAYYEGVRLGGGGAWATWRDVGEEACVRW